MRHLVASALVVWMQQAARPPEVDVDRLRQIRSADDLRLCVVTIPVTCTEHSR
jgi:hypothetical protein